MKIQKSAQQFFIEKALHGNENALTAELKAKVEQCVDFLKKNANPKGIYQKFALKRENGKLLLKDLILVGNDIGMHLMLSSEAYLIVATLGHEVDRVISNSQYGNVFDGYMLDLTCEWYLESYLDDVCKTIIEKEKSGGNHVTVRFSAGYGDFSLDMQNGLLRLVNAEKHLGVYLTDGNMLNPTKSVTAIVGVVATGRSTGISPCDVCSKRNECDKNQCK